MSIERAVGPVIIEAEIAWARAPQEELSGEEFLRIGRQGSDYVLQVTGMADFLIGPDSIRYLSREGLAQPTLRHLLLDQALPAQVGQWGNLVLHASAVNWRGRALLFVGSSSWGKSTLAASFGEEGGYFADDAVMLAPGANGQVQAYSSYHGARLWPGAFDILKGQGLETAEYAHYSSKRRIQTQGDSGPRALPLGAIFLLNDPVEDPAGKLEIVPCSGQQAMMALLSSAFLLVPGVPGLMQLIMEQAGAVTRSTVPVCKLAYPRDHVRLVEVRRAVTDWVGYGTSGSHPAAQARL